MSFLGPPLHSSAALNALSVFRIIAMPLWILGGKLPSRARGVLVDAIPSRRVQRVKHIVRTMKQRSTEIVAEKRAALEKGDESTVRQVDEGKDIMSILCTLTSYFFASSSCSLFMLCSASEHDCLREGEALGRGTHGANLVCLTLPSIGR